MALFPLDVTSEVAVPRKADAPPAEELGAAAHDPRARRILAKSIYRELRQSGLSARDVMSVTSELLSLVTADVKSRREERP